MKKDDLKEIKLFANGEDKLNSDVSAAGVYWHLDHLLQVIIGIGKSLIKSNPEAYKSTFNTPWTYIKTTRKIPRGVGKSPESVKPDGHIKAETLINQIEIAESILGRIQKLPKNAHFNHPYFGTMNLKDALKFVSIHSNHHVKIIKDIIQ